MKTNTYALRARKALKEYEAGAIGPRTLSRRLERLYATYWAEERIHAMFGNSKQLTGGRMK